MQEVEFVSDLVFNFINGLSDFKGASLDAMYSEYDEDFPDSQNLSKRLEACFSKIASLPAASISDTIFSRSPIFFSLIVVLDSSNVKIPTKKLEAAIKEIDDRYNSDKPVIDRPKIDAEFYDACRASTQRIASRRIRDKYIKRFL